MKKLTHMRLRNKLLLGFAVPALITAILGGLIYNSLQKLNKAFHWVEHTHVAVDYGKQLLSSMIDMETGLRGFLVAGDTVFLEPYDSGQEEFESAMIRVKSHVSDNPAQIERLEKIDKLKISWLSQHARPAIVLRKEVNNPKAESVQTETTASRSISDIAAFIQRGSGNQSMDEIRALVSEFTQAERKLIETRTAETDYVSHITGMLTIFGALASLLVSVLSVVLITRNISRQLGTEPGKVENIARSIAAGDLSQDISTDQPASGVLAAMQSMQANLASCQKTDQQKGNEIARIKQALDSASSAVLVTDASLIVIYQNRAAEELFQRIEPALQASCPGFRAADIVGSDINLFLTNQGASNDQLENLQTSLRQKTTFSDTTLQQVFSPILDEQDCRIGTVIEWQDLTSQLAIDNEIQALVDAALEGDLSQRLTLADKDGFSLMLGKRMNALVEICETIIDDTVRVFGALSRYDLTETITAEYEGSYAQVKENANRTVVQLTTLIGRVKSDASMLDSASHELRKLNQRLYTTAEVSSDQANTVSSAVEQISVNINGVASASTQMSASINDIARNASDATQIASEAVQLAESTETTVRQLSASSNDIGNVIKVINSIAEQTNLLALNATIEAARAGDAGKGFAVVANEVKDLAKETAKATEEIGQKVATIQTDSDSAVEAIGSIDSTIQRINDIQGMIATAVQQQTATTNEISRAMNEAADGGSEIAEHSSKAAQGAMQALESTNDAQQSTKELVKLAGELRGLVEQFKVAA